MKILSSQLIREADAYTIKHEPIASIDLMERAVDRLYAKLSPMIEEADSFDIYCGIGNNGGDGLVLARKLFQDNISARVCIVHFSEKQSEDFKVNLALLRKETKVEVVDIYDAKDVGVQAPIAVDAIFGTGLSKPVKGLCAEVIEKINAGYAHRIAIDTPSGLFADASSLGHAEAIIRADMTFSFQLPKLAFMFPENHVFVGQWEIVDIGLDRDFIAKADSKMGLVEEADIRGLLKERAVFAHKGNFGHGLLMAGSYGKTGAAVMAARAALRSGIGLLTCHIPQSSYVVMQTSVAEAMVIADKEEKYLANLPDISPYNAIAVGPGLGKEEKTAKTLKLLIQNTNYPLVLDADALNILSENKTWLSFLPKHSILTPHFKEFERLAGKSANDFDRFSKLKDFAIKHQVYVLLKGAYSCIATPEGYTYFNSSGNPGMAKGGSGDVLTGILLALKAQGYSSLETCLIACYLHGLAADIAMEFIDTKSLTASDIIAHISDAYQYLG